MSQETIKFKSGGADITAELFSPPVVGKHPLVIMAYGTGGMMAPFGPMYISFPCGLAKACVFCLLPDYLAITKTPHDLEMWNSLSTCRTAWVSALCDAVTNVMTLSQVDVSRVALGGFSLGGNLMIHAAQTNRAKAFVDFFAPIVSKLDPGSQIAAPMASSLPPTLIHHGKQDSIVPFGDSVLLEGWLKTATIDNKLISYETQGHPSSSDYSSWSPKSQNDSLVSTVKFLQTYLR